MNHLYQCEAYVFPILFVLNNPHNSDYDDDAATGFSMLHMMCISTLVFIGYILIGILPNKYWPQIIDRPFLRLYMINTNVCPISRYICNIRQLR